MTWVIFWKILFWPLISRRLENWPGTADQAIENPVSDKESSEWKCTVAIYPEDVRGGGVAVLQ